jgi:dephospho-CoA kinase
MLRQLAFSNSIHKQRLDAIMHPLIFEQIETQVSKVQSVYCILAIPLLLESAKKYAVDRVLVVDCHQQTQLQRVLERDQVGQAQVTAIIASQVDRQLRLAAADDVIDNDGTRADLAEQVKNLHNSYLLLATARTTSA